MGGVLIAAVVLLFVLLGPALAALSALAVFGVASLLTNKDTEVLLLDLRERFARFSSPTERRMGLLKTRLLQLEEYERELVHEIRRIPTGNPNHALTEGYIEQVRAMVAATQEELYQEKIKRVDGDIKRSVGDGS